MKLFDKLRKNKNTEEMAPAVETHPDTVYAPVSGTVIPLPEVADEVFAAETLGLGCGIEPSACQVVAPFDGTVNMIADTKHAVGLVSKDGIEVLIHVGLDTVGLNGKGFDVKTEVGKEVTCGQLLMKFDADVIRNAGYKTTTVVVVTNSMDYAAVETKVTGTIGETGELLIVKK